jgi:hypothetical protein
MELEIFLEEIISGIAVEIAKLVLDEVKNKNKNKNRKQ